jgi:hypothetical protein
MDFQMSSYLTNIINILFTLHVNLFFSKKNESPIFDSLLII